MKKSRGGGYSLIRIFAQQVNLLWYLGCLILCESIYAVISFLAERFGKVYLYLSLALAIVIPADVWHFGFLWPFFVLGVLIRKTSFLNRVVTFFKKCHGFIGMIIGIVLFGLAQFYKTEYTFYNASNYLFGFGTSNILRMLLFVVLRYMIYVVTTISILCLLFMFYEKISGTKLCAGLSNIGKHTLGIFCIHILALYHVFRPLVETITHGSGIFPTHPIVRYYLVGALISVVVIAVSYLLTKLINKIRELRRLLIGR